MLNKIFVGRVPSHGNDNPSVYTAHVHDKAQPVVNHENSEFSKNKVFREVGITILYKTTDSINIFSGKF